MRKGRSSKYGNENTASQAVGSTLNQVGADKEGGTPCRRKQHRKPLLLQSRFQTDRKRVTEGDEDVSGTPEA